MNKSNFYVLILSCLFWGFVSVTHADLEFSSETVYATPCSSVAIDVFASDPDAIAVLDGFNLPIDIGFGPDGDSIPAELMLATPFLTDPVYGPDDAYNDFGGFGLNFDIVCNIIDPSGSGVPLSASPTLMFTLTFVVDPMAIPGTVIDVTLVDQPDVPLFDATGMDLGIPTIGEQGLIIVSAQGDINRDGFINRWSRTEG